ncbi:DNA repair protein [Streptomyces eurocidicus]|uniref:DNA repair protein n=1 Tax=Streptomyces eurocidicus TaxID=66423 RepID=A0A2N8NZD1_STREU|nr:alpha-ketoglutarate-dependent dioxygenase AlkB [Streptomyces eurocidicus]MBB5120823.1 alkylated DNA repair protein (DNA oxidative demethylase) [Streptomyces eurocidicus]MBF6054231.1 alpha-ketoglutarate-dependent dioxygenase AlkB [Streptomyces eurocidicus]PNE34126.1 DNA repair protein [Streptomyces eurocidicus]
MDELFPRPPAEVAPGAVHVPGWLDLAAQARLLDACRTWAMPPAGLRTVRMPSGGSMSVRTVGLGWHWFPYGYSRTVADGDGAPVKPFPAWLDRLAQDAVRAAREAAADAAPFGPAPAAPYDTAAINFYGPGARMGMHQDRDERSDAPIVSLSLGDGCVFRFGTTRGRERPWTDVELRSGDLFVFGGPARLAYHGVPRTHPDTAPPGLGLTGRLNITLRVSGLD